MELRWLHCTWEVTLEYEARLAGPHWCESFENMSDNFLVKRGSGL